MTPPTPTEDSPPDDRGYRPCVLICMGVSGAGKTTVAHLIDDVLGWPFQEGDELHPPANVDKMSRSIPLTDEDRWPWLEKCKAWIDGRLADDGRGLITCSALKREYRDYLIAGRTDQVRILYLRATRDTLIKRVEARRGHYMPPALLDSQLATLQEPAADEHPIVVSVEQSSDEMSRDILQRLRA